MCGFCLTNFHKKEKASLFFSQRYRIHSSKTQNNDHLCFFMLQFHGIEYQNGVPQRFSKRYNLLDSIREAVELVRKYDGESEKMILHLDKTIHDLFRGKASGQDAKYLKYQAAHLNRVKDFLRFFYRENEYLKLKLSVANILVQPVEIETKWHQMEDCFKEALSRNSFEVENLLSDPDSELYGVLQMVTLLFLDQTDEIPPANLLIKFVHQKFPAHKWISTDTLNYEAHAGWITKNRYCRFSYLSLKLHRLFQAGVTESIKDVSTTVLPVKSQLITEQDPPTSLSIEYAGENEAQDKEQLSLIPESPQESLLSFQKMLQRKYQHEGVKHFLAILRQIATRQDAETCYFNIQKHLQLVAKPDKKGDFHPRQQELFYLILEEMKRLNLVRRWEHKNQPYETRHPFISEIGRKYFVESETERSKQYPVLKIMLDKIFAASVENPLKLGDELRLIPEDAFRENVRKHNLVTVLNAYFSGTWLHEYGQNNGVATKTAEEILEGCAIHISPSSKYRIIHKLKSELTYMEEQQYISKFSIRLSGVQNPWKDVYSVQAPVEFLTRAQAVHPQVKMENKGLLHV